MIPEAWFSWCSTDTRTALPDAVFNGEAFGRGDAFQAEAPEGRGQDPDDLDNLIGVLGLQGDGDGVHVGKGLVDNRLGLQLGQHRRGPDIAELINLAAVRDQGDGIAPAGITVGGERDSCSISLQTAPTPGV